MERKSNHETELQTAHPQGPASIQNSTNVLRRHIKEDPIKEKLAKHRLWMNSMPHEYPMPYTPYKIGVYIRYYNQTRYENYLEKHLQQFMDDIALCPQWTLVDFYGDSIRDDVFKDHVGRVSVKAIIRAAKERRPGALGYSEAMILEYNKKSKFRLSLKTLYGGKPMNGEDDFGEE